MLRRRVAVAVFFLGAAGGCSTLLGDFTIGDSSTDATPEAMVDSAADSPVDVMGSDVIMDVGHEEEAAITCGVIGLPCCVGSCSTGTCCTGMCVDEQSDSTNCGLCKHDCMGGTCKATQCQPQELVKVTDTRPGRVRLDSSNVYFITINGNHTGSLYSCAQSGCGSPTTLLNSLYYAYDLVLDDSLTNAFVANPTASTSPLLECALGGCSMIPTSITLSGSASFNGLDFRGTNVMASYGVQPHQFHTDGTGDVDLGNGNEGTNSVLSPPGTSYVYWNGLHKVRVATSGTANSYADFATLGSSENTLYLGGNSSYVAFNGDPGTGNNIYTCPIAASCPSPKKLSSGEYLGYVEGVITIASDDTVYWIGADNSSSNVVLRACPATGCTSVTTVATVKTTAFKGYAGGVVTNATFVFFTLEDNGTSFLYRVAR